MLEAVSDSRAMAFIPSSSCIISPLTPFLLLYGAWTASAILDSKHSQPEKSIVKQAKIAKLCINVSEKSRCFYADNFIPKLHVYNYNLIKLPLLLWRNIYYKVYIVYMPVLSRMKTYYYVGVL